MKIRFTLLCVLYVSFSGAAQVKILFDATKAQMAGNADWVIDADLHNLYTGSTSVSIGGFESNPQRFPNPPQSGINASTTEDYWQGALSYWAVDCAKEGYIVESLPYNAQITYGSASNVQDLINYTIFVVDEPNVLFTAAEKDAIVNFVKNGGSLLMIADHAISDRNNDGYDSLQVWNDLMQNNNVLSDPFGISFDSNDFSQTTTNIANLSSNPILHGIKGNVTRAQWSGGTTMTLNPTVNNSVKGLIYKTGSSTIGTTNVMVAQSNYLAGKVVAIGDSSIPDDGTGDTGDFLYDGYIADANGNHQILLMNAIIWLATPNLSSTTFEDYQTSVIISPNPVRNKELTIYYHSTSSSGVMFIIYDSLGRIIKQESVKNEIQTINCSTLTSGVYYGKTVSEGSTKTIKFIIE
ncbi:T9SS type A sorting domain-containing protein [Flavobacterium sp.]|uniref:T9SS type A sorting domain-containing protein n=1 Tax=Flavobacterium sp. TaxID=239 RepID=UPI0025D4C410|nr:T9SS type A sorting domain-containing protein [Flavobacterium sp.]